MNEQSKISAQQVSSIERAVREGLTRLSEMIRKEGAPYPLTSTLVSLWIDVFLRAGIRLEQVKAAFDKAERVLKAFWPAPGEVLALISNAEESAAHLEAEQKWSQMLVYAQSTSPDYVSRRPVKFKDQTAAAIRAAGGLNWIRDCSSDDLQWARKRFIETYVAWSALEKNQFLLPDGELKNVIAGAAQKLLP